MNYKVVDPKIISYLTAFLLSIQNLLMTDILQLAK
ncbi:hypothetical protein M2326_000168 [Flavobacterium sp. 7A]|nr:hypothetical protein [Flavobacterium sp. 7A]